MRWKKGANRWKSFYDGYVVNAVIDACYKSAKSKKWEPVELDEWRGLQEVQSIKGNREEYAGMEVIKKERLPDGRVKLIVRDKETGAISQQFVDDKK